MNAPVVTQGCAGVAAEGAARLPAWTCSTFFSQHPSTFGQSSPAVSKMSTTQQQQTERISHGWRRRRQQDEAGWLSDSLVFSCPVSSIRPRYGRRFHSSLRAPDACAASTSACFSLMSTSNSSSTTAFFAWRSAVHAERREGTRRAEGGTIGRQKKEPRAQNQDYMANALHTDGPRHNRR